MNRNLCAALLACLLLLPGGALLAKDKVLNFALSGNPDTLDPQKTSGTLTFQTLKSIYDTLVEADQTGAIVPALCRELDRFPGQPYLDVQAPIRGLLPQRGPTGFRGCQGNVGPHPGQGHGVPQGC